MTLQKNNLLGIIRPYRLVSKCFSKYITWICENVEGNDVENYDLISILKKKDFKRVERFEDILEKSRSILRVPESDFVRMFGFTKDLLTDDPEKVHDVLAEPLFVLDLDAHGFSSIKKIDKPIRTKYGSIPTADFVSKHGGKRFAIELKTIRTESWIEEGKLSGNSMTPNWSSEMFRNNAIMKIEDNDKRVIKQLNNTARHYECDCTMLVLYTRRLGPSAVMDKDEYIDELKNLKNRYPEINYFVSKNYFADIVVFYPDLEQEFASVS